MIWVIVLAAVMITAGAAFAVVRAERGPSMLDRTVALDITVTAMIAAVALYAASDRRTDVVPVLVVLSLVGFVGSVTIARFDVPYRAEYVPDEINARRPATEVQVATPVKVVGSVPADYAGWRFEIVDMDGRRVDKVLASREDPASAP